VVTPAVDELDTWGLTPSFVADRKDLLRKFSKVGHWGKIRKGKKGKQRLRKTVKRFFDQSKKATRVRARSDLPSKVRQEKEGERGKSGM